MILNRYRAHASDQNAIRAVGDIRPCRVERLTPFEVATITNNVDTEIISRYALSRCRAVVSTLCAVDIGACLIEFEARSPSTMWASNGRDAAAVDLG